MARWKKITSHGVNPNGTAASVIQLTRSYVNTVDGTVGFGLYWCVPLARLQDIFVTKDSVIFHYSTQIVVPFKMSLPYLSLRPCPMLACCGWLLYPIPMPSPHPWLLLGSGEPEFHCTGQGCRTFQGQFFSIIHILSEMWKDQKDLPRKG